MASSSSATFSFTKILFDNFPNLHVLIFRITISQKDLIWFEWNSGSGGSVAHLYNWQFNQLFISSIWTQKLYVWQIDTPAIFLSEAANCSQSKHLYAIHWIIRLRGYVVLEHSWGQLSNRLEISWAVSQTAAGGTESREEYNQTDSNSVLNTTFRCGNTTLKGKSSPQSSCENHFLKH